MLQLHNIDVRWVIVVIVFLMLRRFVQFGLVSGVLRNCKKYPIRVDDGDTANLDLDMFVLSSCHQSL